MRDRPPTNDEIKEFVEQILHGADLEKLTMKMVYNQVCSHYPDFDLTHNKDFIRATVKSAINLEPTIAQMEKLVKFLEENPEIATGIDHTNNAHGRLQTTQKWEAIAKELNVMGGANRSGDSWANFWHVSRSQLNHIIANRKSATAACGGVTQPYTPEMMERMINLLERLGFDEIPAESPSTINLEPTVAQMEKLVKFLEENPEIATGTDHANNAHEHLQMSQKWEAIAMELNLMGGANRSGDSWANLWNVSRSHVNNIIANRKSATGACGGVIQPCTPEMMERMINLLEGLGFDEIPAESPSWQGNPSGRQAKKSKESGEGSEEEDEDEVSDEEEASDYEEEASDEEETSDEEESGDESDTSADEKTKRPPTDDEIKKCVMQILEGANLEQITMKMVCEQVYSHYPDFDLTHKKDFIKATIKSCI